MDPFYIAMIGLGIFVIMIYQLIAPTEKHEKTKHKSH